jgi:hypothetical protein
VTVTDNDVRRLCLKAQEALAEFDENHLDNARAELFALYLQIRDLIEATDGERKSHGS